MTAPQISPSLPRNFDRYNEVFGPSRRPSSEFQSLTKRDAQAQLSQELQRLLIHANPNRLLDSTRKDLEGFESLFSRFINESGTSVEWSKIDKLEKEAVCTYSDLGGPESNAVKGMLDKLVVVKLNGGLGTSMGCQGPKSIIPVRSDLTFLDLTVQQIEHLNQKYGSSVPLVLMNSFNTDEDTQKVIRKYKGFQVKTYTFNQSRYPRINKESLMPIAKNCDTDCNLEGWYPPGHGDFYQSFYNSGLLEHFINEGKEYVFVSNIDNLGATVDLNILNFLLGGQNPGHHQFLMEVTDKTRADVKGGTLIRYENQLRLLEIAQVPKEHVDDFKSVKTFKIFNTNNLWIKLRAMQEVVAEGTMEMEVIVNNKTLDNGLNIIQLEQAVGAAIKSFPNALGVNVPRSRFLPVKKTDDLLLVMSNLYTMTRGVVAMSPKRMFDATPLVKLGSQFGKVKVTSVKRRLPLKKKNKKMKEFIKAELSSRLVPRCASRLLFYYYYYFLFRPQDFLKRFSSIPDMLELDHLSVSGDVNFGKGVVLKGTVIIIANHGDRIDIPTGAILENKIISGNLRILDH